MLSERGSAPARVPSPTYRPPLTGDGSALWALACRAGLDENSPYAYLLWTAYFADSSVVAEVGGRIAGFVNGFRVPERPDTLFVWQVGVDAEHRGAGIARGMLVALVARCPWLRYVEATVNPSNAPSAALFRGLGARFETGVEESLLFDPGQFPPGGHEAEVRFRIGPLPER